MSHTLRSVSGWVRLQDTQPPGRSVRLRVTDPRAGTTLAEAVSLPDGQFAVVVSLAPFHHSALVVEAVDSAGGVLGRQEASGDGPTILTLDRALPEENTSPPGLLTGAVADLAGRITRLEASGDLPTGALAVLDATLGRLAWLDGLLEPARRAIFGDTAAAAVVREALGAWAREAPCPAPVVADSSSPDEEDRSDEALAVPDTLVSTDAVGTFVSAILTAGRTIDEQVEMADGLGAVLSIRPWLETLAGVAASGSVATMQVMMGAPGPMPLGFLGLGGLPPGGLPRGGLPGVPGFPGLPGGFPGGKPKGGLVITHPTVKDVVSRFRSPAMLPPSDKERCLILATTEAARLRDAAPVYRITGLAPADACPGTQLTITGRNFGTHGSVVFPGTAAPIPNSSAIEWTDGRIRVIVPMGAAPGPITLSILEATLVRCGQVFTVFRTGGSDRTFDGGTAAVTAFLLDGSKDPLRVDPGEVVSISCDVTVHPTAQTRVFVTQGGVTIADFGILAGGGHRQHDFTAPTPAGPITCIVHLVVSGPCGEVDRQQTLTVAATPHFSVAHLEVTQGVQNTAHTMRFVGGRTTFVRAYLTSGLGAFSYDGTPGQVGNVTGKLRVERGGLAVASIPAITPITVGPAFADADRSNSSKAALLFVVPGSLMDGDVTMRVTASVAGLPGFGSDTPGTSGTRTVHVERARTLTVMRLRMGLSNPAHPLAAPTVADWQVSAVGTQDRYPLRDAGLLVQIPVSGDVLSTDRFLGKDKGWHQALDELDDYADRFDSFNTIFACIVPADPGVGVFALNGTSHVADDGLFENDRRCFLAQARLRATFAHEMAHTLGVDHAPCANPGKAFPKDIDPNLPGATEPGVVGWRSSDGKLIPPLWSELMSYCTPTPKFGDGSSAVYDDRWPSGALWNILIDQLN